MIGFLVENVAFSFPAGFLMSFSIVALFHLRFGVFFVCLSVFALRVDLTSPAFFPPGMYPKCGLHVSMWPIEGALEHVSVCILMVF